MNLARLIMNPRVFETFAEELNVDIPVCVQMRVTASIWKLPMEFYRVKSLILDVNSGPHSINLLGFRGDELAIISTDIMSKPWQRCQGVTLRLQASDIQDLFQSFGSDIQLLCPSLEFIHLNSVRVTSGIWAKKVFNVYSCARVTAQSSYNGIYANDNVQSSSRMSHLVHLQANGELCSYQLARNYQGISSNFHFSNDDKTEFYENHGTTYCQICNDTDCEFVTTTGRVLIELNRIENRYSSSVDIRVKIIGECDIIVITNTVGMEFALKIEMNSVKYHVLASSLVILRPSGILSLTEDYHPEMFSILNDSYYYSSNHLRAFMISSGWIRTRLENVISQFNFCKKLISREHLKAR